MRNKGAEMCQSGNGYKTMCKAAARVIIHKNPEQQWTFPGVAKLPKLLKELNNHLFRRL